MTYYQLFKKESENTNNIEETIKAEGRTISKEEIDRVLQETFNTRQEEGDVEAVDKEKIEFTEKTFQSVRNYFSQRIEKEFLLMSSSEVLFKEESLVKIQKAYERFVIVERETEDGEVLQFAVHYGSLLSGDDVMYHA